MYGYDNTCPLLLGRATLHGFPTIGSGFWSWRGIPRPVHRRMTLSTHISPPSNHWRSQPTTHRGKRKWAS